MALLKLIYVSKVARQIRFSDVELIAEKAADRNRGADLTGLLLYTPSHFIQVLEGPEDNLTATFERIKRDERHTEMRLLDRAEIEQRAFGRWSMKASMLPAGVSTLGLDNLDALQALELLRSCG